jgi:tripartite-type tricarboxylate transporter receptor subunit TctC
VSTSRAFLAEKKLRGELIKASRDPELQRRLAENGTPIVASTSEEMQALMASEAATMNELVKTLGIRQQ